MKTVKFKPLRVIKKTGKVTVSSYMQWRKVMVADYSKFNLVIDDEHKLLDKNAFVYDHKGKQLFFLKIDPAAIPVFQWHELFDLEAIREHNRQYGILWNNDSHTNYNVKGLDCDGIPTFSHFTADYIATHYQDITEFEPLTVAVVTYWYGWFLYQLNNSKLTEDNI